MRGWLPLGPKNSARVSEGSLFRIFGIFKLKRGFQERKAIESARLPWLVFWRLGEAYPAPGNKDFVGLLVARNLRKLSPSHLIPFSGSVANLPPIPARHVVASRSDALHGKCSSEWVLVFA
jgi:hypothetical protein